MIPTTIPLTLRLIKGSSLTFKEGDDNFVNLRDAIFGIGNEFTAGRVRIGVEPALGDRTGVLWVPVGAVGYTDYEGVFVWATSDLKWHRINEYVRYADATNVLNAYTATVPGRYETIQSFKGIPFFLKIAGVNDGAATLTLNGFATQDIQILGANALEGGELKAGMVAAIVFDGSDFQLLNPAATTDQAAIGESAMMYWGGSSSGDAISTTVGFQPQYFAAPGEYVLKFKVKPYDPGNIVEYIDLDSRFKFRTKGKYQLRAVVPLLGNDGSSFAHGSILWKNITTTNREDSVSFLTYQSAGFAVTSVLETIFDVSDVNHLYQLNIATSNKIYINFTDGALNYGGYPNIYQRIIFTKLS